MNQCVTWLCAKFTKTFDLHIFITSCLCLLQFFSIEMVEVEEQAVCLHHILLQTWQQCSKYSQNSLTSFWGCMFRVRCKPATCLTSIKWPNVSWQWWMFWFNFNRNNNKNCCRSAWQYPQGAQVNNPLRLQHCDTVEWDMPEHFVSQTQHEADCYRIRAKAADWWPEATSAGSQHWTLLWLSSSALPPTTWQSSHILLLISFSPLWLLHPPQDKKQVGGVKIWHCRGYPGCIIDNDTKGLPWQLPIMEGMSGLLCTLPRGLFGRGRRDEDFESAYFLFRYISGTFGQHLIVTWCVSEESADSR